jgi:hypothetical protein
VVKGTVPLTTLCSKKEVKFLMVVALV